ncbi:hypothetical protein ACHAW5_000317 [Stephanodiscus triporus]|uniref:Crinkler (CRN) family protein n=1 Tax=Stephanodiscus triporus TaxID=2934178 RepID=A0ABD3MNQ4_9STRA
MLLSSSKFWFQLLDYATGQPYEASMADFVSLPPGSLVAEFRDAVLSKNPNKLDRVDASDLLVYKNKASFDKRNNAAEDEGNEEALDPTQSVDGLGSKEVMLVVVVPSPRSSSQTTTDLCKKKEPNQKRKQRWIELNEILDANAKKSKANGSTAYSYVTWSQVESVFAPLNYVQATRTMDDTQLDFLKKYLSFTTKCFGAITTGKEAKRLHFIAPILVCVCFLLKGDVKIVAEEDLVGNFVKAHGHFEFMLTRGTKAVCIVEAKKDDIEQGMAQDLVGCEVAAEVGGLDVVYGIVTNYIQWNFFCSRNDKVEIDECSLRLSPNGPERESLKEVAEKIYSMLADEDTQTD